MRFSKYFLVLVFSFLGFFAFANQSEPQSCEEILGYCQTLSQGDPQLLFICANDYAHQFNGWAEIKGEYGVHRDVIVYCPE